MIFSSHLLQRTPQFFLGLAALFLIYGQFSLAQEQYESPLKQLANGVPAEQIRCLEGYDLILATSNGSPACVRLSSADILVKRGWGILIQNNPNNGLNRISPTTLPMYYATGSNPDNLS